MDPSALGDNLRSPRLFKGSASKPFLAPRGVHIAKDKLFVSDTGQNRVFIWHKLPTDEHTEPDVILGQQSVLDDGRNAEGHVAANTLHYPSGLWSDGKRLIVADAWNHRVLIWNALPTEHGQAADVVLGQPDFEHNDVNVEGIAAEPSARSMHWPYGLCSDGQRLWVADTGNRRVLFYKEIPTESYTPADDVIGKEDMMSRDYDSEHPIWPYSVKLGPNGELAVADTQFYRSLIWRDWRKAFTTQADVIIGQPDFQACGQNQFGLFPDAHTLNWTYDLIFHKDGILVNDTGNSRLLYFDKIPTSNSSAATAVIGKRDFKTGSENKETKTGTGSSLYWPFSVSIESGQIAIADTGNHRLVLADLDL